MPRNSKILGLILVLWASITLIYQTTGEYGVLNFANAQGIGSVSGSGGGGGSGTVTSIATSCGISGGPITTTGTISAIATQTTQTGSNYPFVTGDCGTIVYLNNASPQIPTIPQAGTTGFATGWFVEVCNIGAGTQTITPATSTIGGAAIYVLAAGSAAAPKCIGVNSNGTNYALDLTGPGGSTSFANPSATASDTAVNGVAATAMRSDASPAIQKGSNAQFGLVEGDGTSVSLTAGVAQRSALTGDVTASAGSSATTLAAGSASNLNSGTLAAARMPALTGNCVTTVGAVATTCDIPHPGYVAGNWYLPITNASLGTGTAQTANRIICSYGAVAQKITISNIGFKITVIGTTNSQLALYTSVGGSPGALIGSTANIANSGLGIVTSALAKQIGPGGTDGGRDIWWCSNANDSTVTAQSMTPASTAQGAYIGSATNTSVLGAASQTMVYKHCNGAGCNGGSSTFNTWPASLVGSTWSDGIGAVFPAIIFQVNTVP